MGQERRPPAWRPAADVAKDDITWGEGPRRAGRTARKGAGRIRPLSGRTAAPQRADGRQTGPNRAAGQERPGGGGAGGTRGTRAHRAHGALGTLGHGAGLLSVRRRCTGFRQFQRSGTKRRRNARRHTTATPSRRPDLTKQGSSSGRRDWALSHTSAPPPSPASRHSTALRQRPHARLRTSQGFQHPSLVLVSGHLMTEPGGRAGQAPAPPAAARAPRPDAMRSPPPSPISLPASPRRRPRPACSNAWCELSLRASR
jgi:hypothetical protein